LLPAVTGRLVRPVTLSRSREQSHSVGQSRWQLAAMAAAHLSPRPAQGLQVFSHRQGHGWPCHYQGLRNRIVPVHEVPCRLLQGRGTSSLSWEARDRAAPEACWSSRKLSCALSLEGPAWVLRWPVPGSSSTAPQAASTWPVDGRHAPGHLLRPQGNAIVLRLSYTPEMFPPSCHA
jgi:hypothetical protein